MVNVLFVCAGNICRSPTAEGIFTRLVQERGLEASIAIDSAGVYDGRADDPPDPRAQAVAQAHGIDISGQRARMVMPEDFERFDYIVAMDQENLFILNGRRPPGLNGRISLLSDFAPDLGIRSVPDPYTGGKEGFKHVFLIIETGVKGLLDAIAQKHFGSQPNP